MDASNIQNIHTQVSAVHSVSDAVSVVFVSEGFTNTNVVQPISNVRTSQTCTVPYSDENVPT